MKVVVADTSPLNYLVLIGEVEVLAKLYGEVLVPEVVIAELTDPETPAAVGLWACNLPAWIGVRPTPVSDERLENLDAGERAAILLAEAQSLPVLLLIDDAEGRAEAERRHCCHWNSGRDSRRGIAEPAGFAGRAGAAHGYKLPLPCRSY
jgi:predicted nucleic acid-binding protein